MSEYGDFCREQRTAQQEHRRRQALEAFRFMEEMIGLGFTQAPVGAGFRFSRKEDGMMLRIDFWPSTGKWNVVGTPNYDSGPRKMIKWAKAHTTKHGKLETENPVVPLPSVTDRPTGPGNPPWDDCPCKICRSK